MLALLAGVVLSLPGRAIASFPSEPAAARRVKQDQTKLRTILPNGAVIYVENTGDPDRVTLQLFVSARSAPDTAKTDGYRHLWEHLVAKGRTKGLDAELESQGAFLTAETYRDATVFQIVVKPGDLGVGLKAVQALTELGDLTADDISKEAAIIRQEIALEDSPRLLGQQAWKVAFGDGGLDPLGDPDVMAAASPTALVHLHHALVTGRNVTLVVAGTIDLDTTTSKVADVLGKMPEGDATPTVSREFKGGGLTSADAQGSALALPVASWNAPSTAAHLAAALAIASTLHDSFVTYTPSMEGSLMVVGQTADSDSIIAGAGKLEPTNLFALGRVLAHRWVDHETSVSGDGILTGLLLSEGAGQRAQTMNDNLDQMTVDQFAKALREFTAKGVVEVIGK